ncbi:uncharacterized protein LODBEIA_P33950 [Lodderomyces beijingensis]|uniref:Uncharacterized protein n=1 Tax=Lodderomyces beijingensis TaxID=1775926 RepID=A0ABP0ZPZ4_9ASCO
MHFTSVISSFIFAACATNALFLPTNVNDFETLTVISDVEKLYEMYPNGKVFDDIIDPNEKIFVYDVEKSLPWAKRGAGARK